MDLREVLVKLLCGLPFLRHEWVWFLPLPDTVEHRSMRPIDLALVSCASSERHTGDVLAPVLCSRCGVGWVHHLTLD